MKDIYKVSIEKRDDGTLAYAREKLCTYAVSDKLYFYPFSNAELHKNGHLIQNPGWAQ